jgi:hypothetical protein
VTAVHAVQLIDRSRIQRHSIGTLGSRCDGRKPAQGKSR